ncbi:hybrid sensor histidine kinase/response regulator [Bacteroidia bacterium]|nr:hybrid sensor histidine kinase/response regulator [Bacteroidia bacterium]
MQNTIKKFALLSLIFFYTLAVVKAEDWHPIQVITTSHGLPTDEVRQVYQDKDGYIWIATNDGLCRYDGYQLKTYKTNLYAPELLSSNKLTAIAEDGNHNLWIGTANGLNILHKITGKITQPDNKNLRGNNVQAILTTKDNQVWVGTNAGLHRYDAKNKTFISNEDIGAGYPLQTSDIKSLIEDSEGNIWMGTWSEGITRYNPAEKRFYAYPPINAGNSAHVIFEDNSHNIWVGSWDYGLFRLENPYNLQQVKYIAYRHEQNNPHSLSDNIIYSLSQDLNTAALWVGTRSGLSVWNGKDNTFTNHLPNHSAQSLPYNEINSILRDNSGLMWLGSLGGGVSVVNTRQTVFEQYPLEDVKKVMSSNSVRSIYIDKAGKKWLGIGSYGLVTDGKNFERNPITSTVYQTIQTSKNNAYWFATYGQGLFIFDPHLATDKVQNIRVNTHTWLSSDCVFSLTEDSNGVLWIGTLEGISIFDTKTNEGQSYPDLGQPKDPAKHYSVFGIEEENPTTVWLATNGSGVFKVTKDAATLAIQNFEQYNRASGQLNNDNVQVIYKDSKGRLWLGSDGGGLSLLDAAKNVFVSVQGEYNLPGDVVYSIEEDNAGNLFVATNAGLVKLEFMDNSVFCRTYTTADGLQANSFNRHAAFKTADGMLYFGGHNGYNAFHPALLQNKHSYSPLVITDIKLFNKSLENIDTKLRQKVSPDAPGYTKKIRLSYNYNNFTIEFANLNYLNASQDKYAYKLDGFDKEWQYTDASRRFASYNNLTQGTYRFLLKSLDEIGAWCENESVLTVVILPPFWLTWWAFLIYVMAVLAAIYIALRIAKSKLSLQNALQVKSLEKVKTEELNHAKLQFFTNITHEFLTPLTILSASVDELKMNEPQNKEHYNVMSTNINRLIRLLQQILEFRKAETGNLKLKVSNGDIAAFVKSGVDSFKPLMKKKKMHFSLITDPESIVGYFDRDKVDKILFNLLSNAAKYNKPGGFIQVNVSLETDDKNIVMMAVKDNGDGIQPQDVKGLFKRFYEGDYRRFNTIGTGIGLSLTKDLVNLHKGTIRVESEVGVGTTFFVQLPIHQAAYSENEIDECTYMPKDIPEIMAEPDEDEKEELLKEYSLLLVEDNEELLALMVKLLSKEYNIVTAKNGREAIEILEAEYIDLVISDVMMPVMDGLEFCKYVKNEFELSHVPIILLTAKNKEEDRVESYDAGADGFITKPFNLNVLYSKIKNLLKAKERVAREFKKQYVFETKDLNFSNIDEEFLNNAVACIHQHIDDVDFDQKRFADTMGISKSTLYKKLKSLTGLNTSLFIRNIRLKTACKVIEEKKKIRISELAYSVGFNDPKYFSACFKKEFGMLPSEYLEKILASAEK